MTTATDHMAWALTYLRERDHVSDQQIANYLGTSRTAISEYRRGVRRSVDLDVFLAVCNLLDTTPDDVINRTVDTDDELPEVVHLGGRTYRRKITITYEEEF